MSIRRILGTVSACIVLAFAVRTIGAASQTAPAPDVTAALLTEVHELRLAMERSATVTPRVQLTLARLNIQEQRTVVLSRDLDQIRQQQASASVELKRLSGELEDVQKALPTASDASQRRAFEYEEQALKRKHAQQTAIEDRLRARETEAAQLLAAEQSRWVDLNSKLDDLERLLGPVR
jgi:predicted  nucleic acid-binding Zn-ribbon protein